MPEQKSYADSMAFLALQGQPPVFDPSKRPRLSLAHVTSVPPFVQEFEAALAVHRDFREVALTNHGVHEIRSAADVRRQGSMGLLFGMQHTPPGMTRARLQQFYHAGVRVMRLAYRDPTEYGGGFASVIGLTDHGKEMLEWMAECRILLDLSHANQRTVRMALDFIQKEGLPLKPMISHTGCASVFQHSRNVVDGTMEDVVATGGYIGILLISFYLGREWAGKKRGDPLRNFLKHVVHAVTAVGSEAIGIGSDCPHIDQTPTKAEQQFIRMTRMLKTSGTFGEYFPDRPVEIIRQGNTMFDILHARLTAATPFGAEGFSERVVDNLCGGNFRSYLERSLPR